MSKWFLRIATLYIVAGVTLGLIMAASHNHSMFPVHAHLNLLGWVAMTLFGLFYRVIPAAAETKLAKAHFWLYVPAHFGQMLLLTLLYLGHTAVEPALAAFSTLVGVAFLFFVVVVWKHTELAA
jgi:cbb3-type cytochrome oxidase subunit 1